MPRMVGFPEEGELVVGTVKKVENFGAFVKLEEYSGKEGFIHVAEVAAGWVKYIRDYVREGQKIVAKVLRVDAKKGHIDLSLKQVNEHQRRDKIQQWKNEQRAEKLFEIVAERVGLSADAAWEQLGNRLIDTFGSMYTALETASASVETLTAEGFEGEWLDAFAQVAKENIVPPKVEIHGTFKLGCGGPRGVHIIKEALTLAYQVKDSSVGIKIQYLGAPRYSIDVVAEDYKSAEQELTLAQERVLGFLKQNGGEGTFVRQEA
jgi:translation initiation factor 2 subunit 1